MPTDRAADLAAPITDILARVRSVMASAEPFNPARSTRRFAIGAPDGVSSVFLPPLLDEMKAAAPGIDISLRQLLPRQGATVPNVAWSDALADLEARAMDIAVIPQDDFPQRFTKRMLYGEEFVVALRKGHPKAKRLDIETYCAVRHPVVSHTGDTLGFVDTELAEHGLSRRVALTVPNFMFGLAVLAETDFVSAMPERFIAMHAERFGVTAVPPPVPLPKFRLNIVTPEVALMDAGLAWLVGVLEQIGQGLSARGEVR